MGYKLGPLTIDDLDEALTEAALLRSHYVSRGDSQGMDDAMFILDGWLDERLEKAEKEGTQHAV